MGNEPYFENILTASLVSSSVLLTFSTFDDGSNLLAISFPINVLQFLIKFSIIRLYSSLFKYFCII